MTFMFKSVFAWYKVIFIKVCKRALWLKVLCRDEYLVETI
jgi:hypothetical protein